MYLKSPMAGVGLRSLLALATVVGALLASALAPSSASASAYGIQYWAAFNVTGPGGQNIPVPTGQLAHKIKGSKTHISSEWAHITTKAGFCNWSVTYVYKNVSNKVYRRIPTRVQYGCDTWAYAPTVHPGRVRPGTSCAHLYRNGAYVTKQCHSIY